MPTTTTTPNMNLIKPTVGEDPGPDWATNLNADLDKIDSHNHDSSTGQGVQIHPGGILIDSDLPFNSNNATTVRTTRFVNQTAPLVLATDVGCIYEVLGNLYYNNSSGAAVQITNGTGIVGTAGSIGGLPSGSASANFSAGTFTFQSATAVPAAFSVGPISIGASVVNSKFVTISALPSLAANYTLFLPPAQGAVNSFIGNDGAGNLSFYTSTGSGGSVVLTNSPTINTPTLSGGTINSATINSPTISAGTISAVTMSASTITGSNLNLSTVTNSTIASTTTINGSTINTPAINGGTFTGVNIVSASITTSLQFPSILPFQVLQTGASSEVIGISVGNNKILATDSAGHSTTLDHFGTGPQLSADVIMTGSRTGDGNITFTVPTNSVNYIWTTYASSLGFGGNPYSTVNRFDATTVIVTVRDSSGIFVFVTLIGMKYA